MKKTQAYVKTPDERKLNVLTYTPEGKTQGIVHILHGMSEHAGRYDDFASYLAESGMTVYLHDHRCHGDSCKEGEQGMLSKEDTFEKMVDDVGVIQETINKEENSKNIAILGHSMGSVILRRYLQKDPKYVKKAIVMGSVPKYNPILSGFYFTLAFLSGLFISKNVHNRFMSSLMTYGIVRKLKNRNTSQDWLSFDEKVVEQYQEDPKAGFAYNKYFYKEFFKGLMKANFAKEIEKTPNIPMMFISGAQDPLSKNMKTIHKLHQAYDKRIEDFKGEVKPIYYARHEVLNERNKEYTYEYLFNWMTK